ncbi:MAG: LVIVD repeat-containing protein [Actinomycetota bacterium]
MRKMASAVLAFSLIALVGGPSGSAVARDADLGPSAGGLSSDNVEFIRHIPLSQNGVGGRLIDGWFYANDQNKIMIFDVSTPEDPQLTGVLPMPQEWLFSREDLDGNGRILIVPNTVTGRLYVIDVEDKSNPQIISELPGAQSHTSSCVLDCRYVYNSGGQIIDLTDPTEPKLMKEKWGDGKPVQSGHDVEEVARGLVLTASQPIMLLDARKNPLKPKLLALGANDDQRFIHTPRWPSKGKDKFLLMAGETNFRAQCTETSAAFMTWDATKWKKTKTFKMIDEYRMKNGTLVDGNPPANISCSSHWHEAHPRFKNGGIVAAAFFEHGTRFMKVNGKGKIEEIGWFVPWAGSTSAVYWITDEILYTLDYDRGIDVIRYTGKA